MDGDDDPGGLMTHPVLWFRRRPFVADAGFAVLLFAVSVGGLFSIEAGTFPDATTPDALAVVLLAGIVLPLAWRRVAPVAVLAVTVMATVPYWVLGYIDYTSGFALFIAIYAVGAYRDRPVSLYAFAAATVVLSAVILTGLHVDRSTLSVFTFIGNVTLFVASWALGESFRSRRAYLRELELRAAALERTQELIAQQAVDDERRRIARELHDVVAHSMSVMVVQAGAARRVLDRDPDASAQAMAQVEATGREALAEMRRLLGVLRDEDGEVDQARVEAPQPGLARLDELIAGVTESGVAVVVDRDRLPALPPGIDLTAYRIVQEALTNVLRHAAASHVDVRVALVDDRLVLQVDDDGRGAAASNGGAGGGADGGAGAGHGITGMRERVALVGGDLQAQPRPGGGFRVRAELPLDTDAVGTRA